MAEGGVAVVVCDRMLGPVAVLLCNRCCLSSCGRSEQRSGRCLVDQAYGRVGSAAWGGSQATGSSCMHASVLYCSNCSKADERASLQLSAPETRAMRICVCLSSGWYDKGASSPTVVHVRV
jgi:hypothetical protein